MASAAAKQFNFVLTWPSLAKCARFERNLAKPVPIIKLSKPFNCETFFMPTYFLSRKHKLVNIFKSSLIV